MSSAAKEGLPCGHCGSENTYRPNDPEAPTDVLKCRDCNLLTHVSDDPSDVGYPIPEPAEALREAERRSRAARGEQTPKERIVQARTAALKGEWQQAQTHALIALAELVNNEWGTE